MKKRLLSLGLSVVMMLGLLPAGVVPAQAAGHPDVGVLGGIYSTAILDQIWDEVKSAHPATDNSVTASIGPLFHLYSHSPSRVAFTWDTSYREENGDPGLFQNVVTTQNSMDSWDAVFMPRDTPEAQELRDQYNQVLKTGQVTMRVGATLEDHGKSFPWVRFNGQELFRTWERGEIRSLEGSIGLTALSKDDQFVFGGDSCITPVQRSSVKNFWAVLVDDTAPSVVGAGFEPEDRILKLYTSEPVRWSSGSNVTTVNHPPCTLQVRAADPRSKQEKWTFDAKLIYVSQDETGPYMGFQVQDQDVGEYQLTRIMGGRYEEEVFTFGVRGIYDAYAPYIGEGSGGAPMWGRQHNTAAPIKNIGIDSPVTDMAGNPVSISAINSMDLSAHHLAKDTTPPEITGVSVSGSMINGSSKVEVDEYGQPTGWPEDLDRSAIFAGVGAQLFFTLEADEALVCEPDAYLELNVERLTHIEADTDTGTVEHWRGAPVKLRHWEGSTFGPLVVTEDMFIQTGGCIRPMRFVGRIKDQAGNVIPGVRQDLSGVMPRQTIFLDVATPDMELVDLTPTEKMRYDPENKILSFKLEVNDVAGREDPDKKPVEQGHNNLLSEPSGHVGKLARVALGAPGTQLYYVRYQYCVTDSEAQPELSQFNEENTRFFSGSDKPWEMCSYIAIPMTGHPVYLHLRFDPSVTNIPDGEEIIPGGLALYGYTEDWAGNHTDRNDPIRLGTDEPSAGFCLDKKAPAVTADPLQVHYNEGSPGGTVDLNCKKPAPNGVGTYDYTGKVLIDFDHGKSVGLPGVPVAEAQYRWDFKPAVGNGYLKGAWQSLSQGVESEDGTAYIYTLADGYTFSEDGTVFLFVQATDASGNVTEKNWSVDTNTQRPKANFKVESDPNVPDPHPSIKVWHAPAREDGALAYTKITLRTQAGVGKNNDVDRYGKTYRAILWSDDAFTEENPLDLFDFDATTAWFEADNTWLQDKTELKQDYGPVDITFETGYAEHNDGTINPTPIEGSVNTNAGEIRGIRFAPVTDRTPTMNDEDKVHAVRNIRFTLPDGAEQATDFYLVKGDFNGTQVSFEVINQWMNGQYAAAEDGAMIFERPVWGDGDVDRSQSYIALLKVASTDAETGTEVAKVTLPADGSMAVWLPSADAHGKPLASGLYKVKLHVAKKGDTQGIQAVDVFAPKALLLDAPFDPQGGLWMKQLNFGSLFQEIVTTAQYNLENPLREFFKADENKAIDQREPYSSVVISQVPTQERAHSGSYSVEVGHTTPSVYLGGRDYGETFASTQGGQAYKRTVNAIVGIRVWNAEYENRTHDDGSGKQVRNSIDTIPWHDRDASYYNYDGYTLFTYDFDYLSPEAFAASPLTATEKPYLVPVLDGQQNTIRYQLKLSGGAISPVYEFGVDFTSIAPTAQLKATPRIGPDGLENLELTIPKDTMFSEGGEMHTYLCYQDWIYVNGELQEIAGDYQGPHYEVTDHGFTQLKLEDNAKVKLYGNDAEGPYIPPDDPQAPPPERELLFHGQSYTTAGTPSAADKMANCTAFFLITDESGAATLLVPQVGPGATHERFGTSALKDAHWSQDMYADFDEGGKGGWPTTYLAARLTLWDYNPAYLDQSRSYVQLRGEQLALNELSSPRAQAIGILPGEWEKNRSLVVASDFGALWETQNIDVLTHLESVSGDVVEFWHTTDDIGLADAKAPTVQWKNDSAAVTFTMFCRDKADPTNRFAFTHHYPNWENGNHQLTMVDAFGHEHTYTVTLSDAPQQTPTVTYTPAIAKAPDQVTVTVTGPAVYHVSTAWEGMNHQHPDWPELDPAKLQITGNDSANVTVTVDAASALEGTYLTVFWVENQGTEQEKNYQLSIPVTVAPVNPEVRWSYSSSDVQTGDVVYGNVTATVADKNWEVVDAATGETAQHTFYIGEVKGAVHTFTVKDELGNTHTVTATLPVTPAQRPAAPDDPLAQKKLTLRPSVLLQAYTASEPGGRLTDKQLHTLCEEAATLNPALTAPAGSTGQADSQALVDALGWAVRYRFHVTPTDVGSVKLLIKKAGTEAVTFADQSDAIAGVSLNGAALDISQNADFVLFAVNDRNNFVRMPMRVTQQNDLPLPTVHKTLEADGSVTVTLSSEILTDLKILDGGQEKDSISYRANGEYQLPFSFSFGSNVGQRATVTVRISEVDDTPLQLVPNQYGQTMVWSANHQKEHTNQAVLVSFSCNKPLNQVEAVAADGNTVALSEALAASEVEILASGQTVSVRYGRNYAETLTLRCTAGSNKKLEVELEPVANIDKTAPVIGHTEPEMAKDGRSVKLTFTADETVILAETGKRYERGTDIDYTAETNGTYHFHFSDLAGNAAETVSVEVSGIVRTNPTLSFSTTGGSDIGSTDVSVLDGLKVGDSFYVKADRACEITLNKPSGNQAFTPVAANTWTQLTITAADLIVAPSVLAVDQYGNVARGELDVTPPDTTPPTIALHKATLVLAVDTSELLKQLKDNAQVRDDTSAGAGLTLTLLNEEGAPFTAPTAAGIYPVTYVAKDEAGNTARREGFLRLTTGQERGILIQDQPVDLKNVTVVHGNDRLPLSVNLGNAEPFRVSWKKGMKTVGQMKKSGVTYLLDQQGDSLFRCEEGQPVALELPFGEPGFYTVCITTQGRQFYCFLVYAN